MENAFLNQKPLWLTRKGYLMIMKAGKYDIIQEQIFKNLKKYDIALGLNKNFFEKWASRKKAVSFQSFEKKGFIAKGLQGDEYLTQYEILQAIVRSRSKNGKIYFRLDGLLERSKKYNQPLASQIQKNPNSFYGEQDFSTWTIFELRNITRNKDWFNNTIFYLGKHKLNAKELSETYGIRYLGN